MIPPAFGLAGVNLHTWTGWGSVTYWNAYVANHADARQRERSSIRGSNDPEKFPVAAADRLLRHAPRPPRIGSRRSSPRSTTTSSRCRRPKPPAGSFDPALAASGKALFDGKAKCAACHVPPLFTEPGWAMHTAEEIGDRRLPGQALARRALPDRRRCSGLLDAHEARLLPRRPLRDARGRRRPLRRARHREERRRNARALGRREGRARRVPEVALRVVPMRGVRGANAARGGGATRFRHTQCGARRRCSRYLGRALGSDARGRLRLVDHAAAPDEVPPPLGAEGAAAKAIAASPRTPPRRSRASARSRRRGSSRASS